MNIQVAKFLKEEYNNNYLIINLSNRNYDTEKFLNKVLKYDWVDHQAPLLKLLFLACKEMENFLESYNFIILYIIKLVTKKN